MKTKGCRYDRLPDKAEGRDGRAAQLWDRGRGGPRSRLRVQVRVYVELRAEASGAARQSRAERVGLLGATGIDSHRKYTLKTLPNRPDMIGLEAIAYY